MRKRIEAVYEEAKNVTGISTYAKKYKLKLTKTPTSITLSDVDYGHSITFTLKDDGIGGKTIDKYKYVECEKSFEYTPVFSYHSSGREGIILQKQAEAKLRVAKALDDIIERVDGHKMPRIDFTK